MNENFRRQITEAEQRVVGKKGFSLSNLHSLAQAIHRIQNEGRTLSKGGEVGERVVLEMPPNGRAKFHMTIINYLHIPIFLAGKQLKM